MEDKTSITNDEVIDLFEIFKDKQSILDLRIESNNKFEVVQQNQVEEAEMIEMVPPIHIEEKKVVLEEDLIEKLKFVQEHIERRLGKDKSYSIVVRS